MKQRQGELVIALGFCNTDRGRMKLEVWLFWSREVILNGHHKTGFVQRATSHFNTQILDFKKQKWTSLMEKTQTSKIHRTKSRYDTILKVVTGGNFILRKNKNLWSQVLKLCLGSAKYV